eukprot:Gb_36745 [translate_table: standard]
MTFTISAKLSNRFFISLKHVPLVLLEVEEEEEGTQEGLSSEWDFRGLPAWLLRQNPPLKLQSSDPSYLSLIDRWWGISLPKVAPFIYNRGGSVIMVQIENEYGSYGSDKEYLWYLVALARLHLGDDVIL